MGQIRLF